MGEHYIDKTDLFNDMINKQIKNIPNDKKLQYNDIKRICKYINTSIFDEQKCCLWNGYVTNLNNNNKGTYINFYFRKKKAALHRLLYSNFIELLTSNDYLKFNCDNKGRCCNIYHLKKFKYNKQYIKYSSKSSSCSKKNCSNIKINYKDKLNPNRFTVSFD